MISSFEKKPLKNGIPHSAAVETSHVMVVIGILRARPPMSLRMSKLWWLPEWLTDPAHRNRQHLKNAGVKMWNTAGVQAPTPRPIIMYPSWLTVEYASTFL